MIAARIVLTPGEPAGIGPDLAVLAAQKPRGYELSAIASEALLLERAERLGLSLRLRHIDPSNAAQPTNAGELALIPVQLQSPAIPGQLEVSNAKYVLQCLQHANDLCLQKRAHAVVTGPVQKSIINDAGIAFSGHTEFFAEQSATDTVVMMLATEGLRVALATTHLPLKDVSAAITQASLTTVLRILIRELRSKFACARPRILVCGLNPHAGEGGHLGREEIDTIIPVLDALQGENADLVGPLPADTLFTAKHLQDADAVLAMYHDQGLPVLKYKGFGKAVNITLGLPYIRTSVDHGTALDLAGSGQVDSGSMEFALAQALELVLKSGILRP